MKRASIILGVAGLTAVMTYLAVTRHLAEERAARLDRALMDAESRVMELEAEIEAAKERLAELRAVRQASGPASSSVRTRSPTAPVARGEAPSSGRGAAAAASPSAGGEGDGMIAPTTVVGLAGQWVRYAAVSVSGLTNVVRIEGTSSIHDWQVESHLIGGSGEFGPGFPTRPGVQVHPGVVDARVSVFIPVRSLKSVERDGSPYSDTMDEIMYGKLRTEANRRITYTLTSLTLKESEGGREWTAPFLYEATGKLTVAGVTNLVTMPVEVSPAAGGRIRFAGSVQVKMTDFKVTPPSPSVGGVSIKTADEVTLRFIWWVNRADASEAAR